jgi:tryptophan synthase alpha chain
MSRLDRIFSTAGEENRTIVSIYLTVGFPSLDASLELARAALAGGAELLEIGVPFSDPLADGPTIQASSHKALEGGVTLQHALELCRVLRTESDAGLLLMGYANPFLAQGWSRLAEDAQAVGIDGIIVPDLPPEEAGEAIEALAASGLLFIHMLAPTSDTFRLDLVARQAAGFIYCVSLTGTTGARTEIDADLQPFLERVRARTDVPLVVGFGISTGEHVARLRGLADGVIVGSAFLQLAEISDVNRRLLAAEGFVRGLVTSSR